MIQAVKVCRTEELGGRLYRCDACDFERPVYNSCRNRHCPKCQSLVKARWLEKQTSELLPVGYFHLVFTLPHELNRLILAHKKIGLSLLFKAVSETLLQFGQRRLQGNPWNHRRAAHLGPNPQGSFSSALFGSRRSAVFGSQPLDRRTAQLFVSCQGSEPGVSGKVLGLVKAEPVTEEKSRRLTTISKPHAKRTGSSMRKSLSVHPRPCSITSAATPTAWRSPTTASSKSKTDRSP